jgi:hypothetical protein
VNRVVTVGVCCGASRQDDRYTIDDFLHVSGQGLPATVEIPMPHRKKNLMFFFSSRRVKDELASLVD